MFRANTLSMKLSGHLNVEIDVHNSWTLQSLQPADTFELELTTIEPRSLPIRLPKISVTATSFLFPESTRWRPPGPASKQGHRKDCKQTGCLVSRRVPSSPDQAAE